MQGYEATMGMAQPAQRPYDPYGPVPSSTMQAPPSPTQSYTNLPRPFTAPAPTNTMAMAPRPGSPTTQLGMNGLQSQPLGIQSQPLGIQSQTLGIQSQPLGIQSQTPGMQSQPLGFQSQPLGIQGQPLIMQSTVGQPGRISPTLGNPGIGGRISPSLGAPGLGGGLPGVQGLPGLPGLLKKPEPFLLPTPNNNVTANMTVYQRLDMVTRSRNALVLAVIFLGIFFLAAFIAALILAFPETLIQNIDVTVKSTRTDFVYKEQDLASPLSFAYTVMSTTMCNQVVQVGETAVSQINNCKVEKFEDAIPGVIAHIVVNVPLHGEKAESVVMKFAEAVIRAAAISSVWHVNQADIDVRLPSIAGGGAGFIKPIQLPLLILFVWLVRKLL